MDRGAEGRRSGRRDDSWSKTAAVVLAAGVAVSWAAAPGALAQRGGAMEERGAAAAAERVEVELPLREITLYRSGVGYFARRGQVSGDGSVTLRFDEDQINDILKSLVLLDLDGGRIDPVRYASDEPVSRRLAGFGIDISKVSSTEDLLRQLRGVRVAVDSTEGDLEGEVLAIEARMTVVRTEGAVGHFKEPYVSLVTEGGVRAVAVSRIDSLRILDGPLAEELGKALAVIADARREQTKTVELGFTGEERPRRVMAAYVHETPVWKTSYRLVLPEGAGESGSGGAGMGAGMFTLQGWAIVENTTDEDWDGVRLSLASGRPVSFTMDLYETLYMPRAVVPVPVERGVASKTYESAERERSVALDRAEAREAQLFVAGSRSRGGGRSPFDDDADSLEVDMAQVLGVAQATGAEVGEQFMYTVDAPVTIERQRSAMLPIVRGVVEGRRLSVYTAGSGQRHPMRGLEFTNTSGAHLLPGPIAVFDADAFAGDAQIPHTSREQERILSYALDLDVEVTNEQTFGTEVVSVRVVDGVLVTEARSERTTTYEWTNNDASKGRTLVIEHPKMSDGWELVRPREATEETASMYRFERTVEAGSSDGLTVTQSRVNRTTVALVDANVAQMIQLQRGGKVSQAVMDAVREARSRQQAIAAADERIEELRDEANRITRDQSRIRQNMGSIDRNSDLYRRYLDKLTEQETRLEELSSLVEEARRAKEEAERRLREFLRGLDVR